MKKSMDKFISNVKHNKKLIYFLLVLSLISIVVGSIFTLMLNDNDKSLTMEYINNFIENISNKNLDYSQALQNGFVNQLTYILIVWLLGMSVIGMPVILFMYFSKVFILGFSISALVVNYGFKGCLISLAYIFPHQIVNIFVYTILTLYALKISGKILYCVFKKQKIDFKPIMHNYIYVLFLCLITSCLIILFEVYITPQLISIFLPLIK